ncbi:hypothetical protein NFI96_007361 [Prochilodus magdalenae]|nr:hypothetical protein NFI96_007361 [Prochilodus magdalenae]
MLEFTALCMNTETHERLTVQETHVEDQPSLTFQNTDRRPVGGFDPLGPEIHITVIGLQPEPLNGPGKPEWAWKTRTPERAWKTRTPERAWKTRTPERAWKAGTFQHHTERESTTYLLSEATFHKAVVEQGFPSSVSSRLERRRKAAAQEKSGWHLGQVFVDPPCNHDRIICAFHLNVWTSKEEHLNLQSSPTSEGRAWEETLTGKEIEIDIEPTDKVERIKERVEEKEGIPPQQQRLIYSGKQM